MQVSMWRCISQTRLSLRFFNEAVYFVLFSLHHVADGLCQQKSWGRRERVFLKDTLKTLSLSFQSLPWAMKASGDSEKKIKINRYLHKKQKGCFVWVFVFVWFWLGLGIQTNWITLCTAVNWRGISRSLIFSHEQGSKRTCACLWGVVCAYCCAYAIGNTSLITKVFLALVLPDLVRRHTVVGAGTKTAGSLCLPNKLQSDCTFLALTTTALPSERGIWDMAIGHLQPTSSPLQAGLSLFRLKRTLRWSEAEDLLYMTYKWYIIYSF